MLVNEALSRDKNNLDIIRIFLATLVIFGHTTALNGISNYWADPIVNLTGFTYSGSMAVKVFFFVSGLVVTNSLIRTRSIAKFAMARFFRIMPALLFLLLVTVFIVGPIVTQVSITEYFKNHITLKYLSKNIVFQTVYELPSIFEHNTYKNAVNGSLWTLTYEIRCYLSLLVVFAVTKSKIIWNLICGLIIVDSVLGTGLTQHFMGNNVEINLLPMSFALGALYAINADKIKINPWTVGFFMVLFLFLKQTHYAEQMFIIAMSLLFLQISVSPFIQKFKPNYDISYGVYLWGFLIQQLVNNYLGHVYSGLHFLLAATITIGIAYFSAIYIEYPAMNYGKTLASKLLVSKQKST